MSSRELVFAAAGTGGGDATYVEDVFSTYLYTGNGSTQTITNGIDLAGEGGLVWTKPRNNAFEYHHLVDTARGGNKTLWSNDTSGESTSANYITSFNANGFTLGSSTGMNGSGLSLASWTFRKAPKFFDVVTYTGNSTAGRTVAHNLGSVPGMIFVKRLDGAANWQIYHRSTGNSQYLVLNDTAAAASSSLRWNNTTPTATEFTLGSSALVNGPGYTYVAYLFAHDAGGFGEAGTDNVISCGSYTGNGSTSGPTVTLGFEPQYVLVKCATSVADWMVFDNMRGMTNGSLSTSSVTNAIYPNTAQAEENTASIQITSTGFNVVNSNVLINSNSATYIYMAIRRPMKPPTSGTEVFAPTATAGTTGTKITTNFPVDFQIASFRSTVEDKRVFDRLRGISSTTTSSGASLRTTDTAAESTGSFTQNWDNVGFELPSFGSGSSLSYLNFRRATGFFDVVCYTGTGSATTQAHNLGVVPELMIVKRRNAAIDWAVYNQSLGATQYLTLNSTAATTSGVGRWNDTLPTSTVFTVGTSAPTGASGGTYVAYLFASVAGVSKVGSYTGTGATQTINAALPTGARFVMIKRTDSTGDWYVWDTARGMVSGTDPSLLLNSTAAEVNANSVYTATTGFQIVSTAAGINASGGSYIYLAIA